MEIQAKVTSSVLEKFDHRIECLDRIQAMMIERSNLLVDVDYAKRKVLQHSFVVYFAGFVEQCK